MMTKPTRMLALTSLLAVAVVLPAPAQAETGGLTCTGNFQFDFTPPLTPANTTADATVGGGLVNCQSPNGKYTRLTSAVRTGTGTTTRHLGDQCAPVMTITEQAVLTWNTGEKSKFDITANAYPVVHPNADCAAHGLSQLTSEVLQVFWE